MKKSNSPHQLNNEELHGLIDQMIETALCGFRDIKKSYCANYPKPPTNIDSLADREQIFIWKRELAKAIKLLHDVSCTIHKMLQQMSKIMSETAKVYISKPNLQSEIVKSDSVFLTDCYGFESIDSTISNIKKSPIERSNTTSTKSNKYLGRPFSNRQNKRQRLHVSEKASVPLNNTPTSTVTIEENYKKSEKTDDNLCNMSYESIVNVLSYKSNECSKTGPNQTVPLKHIKSIRSIEKLNKEADLKAMKFKRSMPKINAESDEKEIKPKKSNPNSKTDTSDVKALKPKKPIPNTNTDSSDLKGLKPKKSIPNTNTDSSDLKGLKPNKSNPNSKTDTSDEKGLNPKKSNTNSYTDSSDVNGFRSRNVYPRVPKEKVLKSAMGSKYTSRNVSECQINTPIMGSSRNSVLKLSRISSQIPRYKPSVKISEPKIIERDNFKGLCKGCHRPFCYDD